MKYIYILVFSIVVFHAQVVLSEDGSSNVFEKSVRDSYTVVGLGLGGAVLGLSTLSFVNKPKDHLKNIVIGGAVGIIIGVGIVAMSHASRSQGVYEKVTQNSRSRKNFSTYERRRWHLDSYVSVFRKKDGFSHVIPPTLSYLISF
jgi:hypothetical protein